MKVGIHQQHINNHNNNNKNEKCKQHQNDTQLSNRQLTLERIISNRKAEYYVSEQLVLTGN